ncbi:ABC transporter substrate-binding protein [Bacillus coreaensis]
MKKLLFSTLSLVMVLYAGGCGKFDLLHSATSKGQDRVTIKIAWWGEQPRHDYTMEVIELFERKYPHINIEPEYAYWDDYWKRLAPLAAANQLPDIVQMDLLYLKTYSENNLLEDLSPFIEEGVINTEDISEDVLLGGKVSGALYGFPLGVNVPAIIVDRELLSSAIDSFPESNWTWADYEEIVSKVHNTKGIYGTNGMKSVDVFFSYYLRTKGMNLYNNSGTGLGYEEDQLFVDYFEMQLRLLEKGAFPRADEEDQIKGIENGLLVNKLAPMTWAYSNQYIGILETANRELDLIPPPGPGQGEGLTLRPSMHFSISKSSKNKDAAALFINFFINNIEANQIIKGDRGVPVSSTVAEKIVTILSEDQKKVFDYVYHVKNNNPKVEKVDPLGSIEVVSLLQDISDQILFKKITPSEGAKMFRSEANSILSKKN